MACRPRAILFCSSFMQDYVSSFLYSSVITPFMKANNPGSSGTNYMDSIFTTATFPLLSALDRLPLAALMFQFQVVTGGSFRTSHHAQLCCHCFNSNPMHFEVNAYMLWIAVYSATQWHCTGKWWEDRVLWMRGESWTNRMQRPPWNMARTQERSSGGAEWRGAYQYLFHCKTVHLSFIGKDWQGEPPSSLNLFLDDATVGDTD